MSAEHYILAVDHGTSGIKAAIVTARGKVVDFEFEPTPIHFLAGGGAEQDPDDWWNALVSAVGRLHARAAVPAGEIEAVGVSSTFSTTVAVDADGRHLMNALTWMDSRGAGHVRRLVGGFPSALGYNLRRAYTWLSRTAGAPSLSGKDDAAHVLVYKHDFPDVYRRAHALVPSKDYLVARLTGSIAASFDSMQLFWVTDVRDPFSVRYDDELIEMLGIDRAKLPPMVASTDIVGTLSPKACEELGLGEHVRVVSGSPDHQCACIGAGAVEDYDGHLYVGTSSWIECMMPAKKTDPLHAIASFPTSIPGRYQCINEQDLAGGALSFLADNILFHESRLGAAAPPERPYEAIDEVAGEVAPGADRVLFTPWLNGERTPVDDLDLRGGFHNLSATTDLRHMVRAVLEGVALNTRWALVHVERFLGRRLEPLRMVGGGAQSRLWCQIFADVLDRRIHVIEEPLQANARGAAFIAAVGCGWTRFEDVPSLVGVVRSHEPQRENRPTYDELYATFLRIHRANKPIYRRLNRRRPR